jgi:hypothetical protein
MSIGFVTIAALMLLLPGIGFIAGVNFADKNLREIVFRNTPSEIGYVILVSAVIHLLFSPIPYLNAAQLYVEFHNISIVKSEVAFHPVRAALVNSFLYFFVTSAAGFVGGLFLGRGVRRRESWRFFAKHPWMLELPNVGENNWVFARVLLKHKFSVTENPDDEKPVEYMIGIEGILRNAYFDANGTLIYLVFRNFTEVKVPLKAPPYVGVFVLAGERTAPTRDDQLLVEGREIAMARYFRLPTATAERPEALDMLKKALQSNGPSDPTDGSGDMA